MTSRERLRRCLSYEELDRPGVYSRTGFPVDDPTYDALKAYLWVHSDLKRAWSGAQFETPYDRKSFHESYSEDFQRHRTVLHTPAGNLECSSLVNLKGHPGLHETFLLKTAGDAEKYLSLPLPVLGGEVSSSFHAAEAEIGERGIVDVELGLNPAGAVAELCGSETFAILSVTDRDVVHALCERQQSIVINRVKFLLDNEVGQFFSMLGQEYVVPPLHSPADFYDFNVKYDKPIINLIHNANGWIHIHCHGRIKRVFQGFLDMGADVLHPFEPPPMGDITAVEAKELARGRLCLEGNIEINRMYEASPEEIREETKALIAAAFDDRCGLIVCPSASPYIRGKGEECFTQYKAMIDTVVEWKDCSSARHSSPLGICTQRISRKTEALPN